MARVKTSLKTAPKTLAEWNFEIRQAKRDIAEGQESKAGAILSYLAKTFYPWKVDSLP